MGRSRRSSRARRCHETRRSRRQPSQSLGAPAPRARLLGAVGANLVRGQEVYAQACVVCHGEDGQGGHGGGAPLVALKDLAATIQTVTAGRNNMPPFNASFTPEQIRDVSAYVVQGLARR
jgi:mono/diheme cytochrome c family protein